MTMFMTFASRTSQTLHDEHGMTVALMERFEQAIVRNRRGPPNVQERSIAQLLCDLSTGVEAEVERHFTFEETKLFSYLTVYGDGEIAAHLTDEHNAIRPLGHRIASLARHGFANGFEADQWTEFCRLGGELCERMLAHIQKEEMALLPLLEEALDANADAQLHQEYTETA